MQELEYILAVVLDFVDDCISEFDAYCIGSLMWRFATMITNVEYSLFWRLYQNSGRAYLKLRASRKPGTDYKRRKAFAFRFHCWSEDQVKRLESELSDLGWTLR